MIIKIFSQSKPINLIIASSIVIVGFLVSSFLPNFNWNFSKILSVCVAIMSVLAVDFISKENQLSHKNSYVILFFSFLFNLYWIHTNNSNFVYANFFVLLALRKIISLKTPQKTAQKIFDAGFWIAVATLFSFWSVLFYVVLFTAVFLEASDKYKYFLIPFVSIFALYVIANSYSLFVYQTPFQYNDDAITLNFKNFTALKSILTLSFLSLIVLLSLLFLPKSIKTLSNKNKTSYTLMTVALFTSIIIFVFTSKIAALLFSFFPITVLLSIFFERITKKWMQNAILFSTTVVIIMLYFI